MALVLTDGRAHASPLPPSTDIPHRWSGELEGLAGHTAAIVSLDPAISAALAGRRHLVTAYLRPAHGRATIDLHALHEGDRIVIFATGCRSLEGTVVWCLRILDLAATEIEVLASS